MDSYNSFSQTYDVLTQNVDYEAVFNYVSGFFSRYGVDKNNKILDLACGTGSLTLLLEKNGYDVTGLDLSPEMLSIAQNKCNNAKYICASMDDFSLPYKLDGCISMLDSINHLKNKECVLNCFRCVNNAMNNGGIFIFDVNTVYKHEKVLSGNTFVFDEDDFFLSWDNENAGYGIVRILIDIFFYNGKNYDRQSEEFFETAYELDDIKSMLNEAHFNVLGMFDGWNDKLPQQDSQRVTFICERR